MASGKVRLSAQVYNDLDDYRYFAGTVRKICKELDAFLHHATTMLPI